MRDESLKNIGRELSGSEISDQLLPPPYADIVCGGFPCQDISNAGDRAGISGPRSGLWKELLRCLCVVRPLYGIVENVAALLTRGMGTVLGDMAESGLNAEWDCLPASTLGALHHRDRVFIVAHGSDAGGLRLQRLRPSTKRPWTWEQFKGLVQAELRLSVPAGKSGGVSDGIPNRIHRLKSLGNAVVPQVAQKIGEMILNFDRAG